MTIPAIEDLWNQALRAGDVPMRVEQMYEGSDAAKGALELYGQCRDELISQQDWSFSRRRLTLTLLKGPPPAGGYNYGQPWSNQYAPPGWLFEYAYPADCLALRAITYQPGLMPDLDPLPAEWTIDDDLEPIVTGTPPNATVAGPEARVILSNVQYAIAVYRAQVTNPAFFPPDFIKALVESLGKKFAGAFGAGADQQKLEAAEAAGASGQATLARG